MPSLPRITAPELRRKLIRLGFVEDRQRGSHLVLRYKDNPARFAVVAMHSRGAIPPGTLSHILATAQVSVEELNEA
ncbi:MAG TPA: type II toxin-antitoxin system HicA family toxin [Spirochaetia bacterium]|nr:type II toxin-antitoxin system HicA family toxin [Spirochaetia bacterium]